MIERFDFTDAIFKGGVKLPGTELITAHICIDKKAMGGDTPDVRNLVESSLRIAAAISTLHGTDQYEMLKAKLLELVNFTSEVCNKMINEDQPDENQLTIFDLLLQTSKEADHQKPLN